MSGTNETANVGILPPESVIGFIMEIARQVRGKGVSGEKAILIAQSVISGFAERFGGGAFYFATKRESASRVFLQDRLNAQLQQHGISTDEAGKIAGIVIDKFYLSYARDTFYIPKTGIKDRQARASRNAAIVAAYKESPTFDTIRRLATEHDLTMRMIYFIIRKKQKASCKRRP